MKGMFEVGNTQFYLSLLSEAGLIALMFITGLHSSRKMLHAEQKDSLYVSLLGVIVPFAITFTAFYFLGYSFLACMVIAICMTITAVATNAEILIHLKKLSTKVGSVIVEAGLFDDFLGVVLFSLVIFALGHGNITDHITLILVLAAFLAGLRFQKIKKYAITDKAITFAQHGLIPFFFISIGLQFDIVSLSLNPFLVLFTITIAIVGKLFGTMLAYPLTSLTLPQLYLIGWAMNSRGTVELVIALIALQAGIISSDIYSSLVAMALITTLIFPVIVSLMLHHDPQIMGNIAKHTTKSKHN